MKNKWLLIAALSGAFSVAFGAFAAHGLANVLPAQALDWIDTALQYQWVHSLALMAVALLQLCHPKFAAARLTDVIAAFWTLGMLLFCGSLYALAFGAARFMAWLTPLGGLLFLLGWLLLAYGSLKNNRLTE
ncbi:DUF423 domain-containing protein [Necropsobacter massiliensis]|uniref:DUF423 domain-containing protein n=1 Tax=Necropsobacter massiliensis TaxID=1400001 RepID=UPI000595AE87|nr:DUF423 domain-containing protein [Necropsobacter massiliensis]